MKTCSKCGSRTTKPITILVRNHEFIVCRSCENVVRKAAILHRTGPVQDKDVKKRAPIAPTIEMFDRSEYLVLKDREHS